MSCLSLFLEVFGHLFIYLPSGVGYLIYTMKSQYIIIVFILSLTADFGRKQIGMRFGTHYFARYVAPDMRLEGAILSILTPMFVSYLLSQLALTGDYKYLVKMKSQDYMWIGHMTGFLSLMGYLMISFFKRCAYISESIFVTKP
jgi:CDP-diglyceride synthetase